MLIITAQTAFYHCTFCASLHVKTIPVPSFYLNNVLLSIQLLLGLEFFIIPASV